MIKNEHKNILIIVLLVVSLLLLTYIERKENEMRDTRYFFNEVASCLAKEKITFKKTARELFEECRHYEDIDDIESCMDDQEIQAEKTLGEYYQECEQGIIDYYNYVSEMEEAVNSDREPFTR